MGYSWAFVGEFKANGEVLKNLQRLLPAQQSELEHIRDDGSLHDRVYSKTGLSIRRLSDGDEYKELLADVRKTLAKIAKAGASGTGDLVSSDDGPERKGVHFEIKSGKVKETEAAADKVRKSKPYRALVARHARAFDDEDESGNDVVNVAVREAILERIGQLSDEALIAAARATKLTISTGPTDVPLLKRYARPSNLRKALAKGGKEWCDRINDAPLLILAVVEANVALLFARRIIDESKDRFDPLKTSALTVLARSPVDEDFERLWRSFEKERAQPLGSFPCATMDLLNSKHPRVDAQLFERFRAELGEPPAYRMPWDDARSGVLKWLLARREHAEAVRLIEEASRLHPWKHFFTAS